ncbi:helix-hairpin-helix domain-containing protein [Gloeocapsopsis dulcis]|uniref:Pathogenicity locus n=1 Tax=Gloeocapsopsis dulcis AAB1 = 1H9 TaxID=1433147 RepID=A0A6N8FXF7_9CHRO|nr:hypothetical protein [Gloeocapsopsis dulcis AAB1 = 1H9]
MKPKVSSELEQIPGVGKKIAQDFREMGIFSIENLKGQDPEVLYQRLFTYQGKSVDRCMLYVFRCAVYYTSVKASVPKISNLRSIVLL